MAFGIYDDDDDDDVDYRERDSVRSIDDDWNCYYHYNNITFIYWIWVLLLACSIGRYKTRFPIHPIQNFSFPLHRNFVILNSFCAAMFLMILLSLSLSLLVDMLIISL